MGDGERFVFMKRMIPDLTFRDSTAATPAATMILKTRNFPGANYVQSNSNDVSQSATVPIEQFTDQVYLRLRGRSFAFRIESDDEGVTWRLGTPRVDMRLDGRR